MPRKAKSTVTKVAPVVETVSNETVSETEEAVSAIKKVEHNANDGILCRSVTSGGLYISGEKTKILYSFADFGDEQEIEYQDLIYLIRSRDKAIFDPRIYVLDDGVVDEYPELQAMYATMIGAEDIKDILNLPAHQMQRVVSQLPKGMLEALKGQVATMIHNHSLDSVTKIKALDEVLGTNHLLMLAQN